MSETAPPSSEPGERSPVFSGRLMRRALLVGIALFLTIGLLLFPSAGWDDSYITYWAAHALADFGRIINVNGDAVEQSSSLGFTVTIAAARRLTGVDASILGRLLSIAFGAAAVWGTWVLARTVSPASMRYAPALVGTCTYFVYWSFGGMEASLAALAGVLIVILAGRMLDEGPTAGRLALLALVTILFVSARPEGPVVLAATVAGLFCVLVLRRGRRVPQQPWEAGRRVSAFATTAAIGAGAVVLLRYWYFGRVFPQPVYVKAHIASRQKALDGLGYVFESVQSEFALVAVAGLVAALLIVIPLRNARRRSAAEVVGGVYVLASLAFIVMSGGDGMHGGRFFLPLIPVAAVLGVAQLASWLTPRRLGIVVTGWILINLSGAALFARTRSHSDPIWAVAARDSNSDPRFHWFERANHDHKRYLPVVAALEGELDRALTFQPRVSLLSGQSGFVLYHLARSRPGVLRYYDRFGLATRDFSDCAISARRPHTEWGLLLRIEDVLGQRDRYERECGIGAPDIIFEIYVRQLSADLDRRLKEAHYAVTLVGADHTPASRVFPGQRVEDVYVAVRERR